jgi:acyl-CoA reductase-like NAD-dependent aldehyde dehydrogenase
MEKLRICSPYNAEFVGETPLDDQLGIEGALERAYRLFLDQDTWLKPHQRIDILKKLASLMSAERDTLARTIALEGGKPILDAQVEVDRAIQGVDFAAGEIARLSGSEIPMGLTKATQNRLAFTIREPIGVVAAISAFNHPLNLIIHQVIPAVAVGCPVVIKPASSTPLSCLRLVHLLKEAGLPDGWCQAVVCRGGDAEKLVVDPRINFLSFIGSAAVGWDLKSRLSPGTRCSLEHGGVAPVIVEPDADLTQVVPLLLKGGFYHAGQVCVSVQKIFAHENIFEELCQKLTERASNLVVGDPLDPKTEVGPLITHAEVDRIDNWVREAKEGGGEILCGGTKLSPSLYAPTIIANPPRGAKVSKEEVFGPVVCVYSYKDRQDAIAEANSLPVAFQAAVFTQNLDSALYVTKRLNASSVMVNDHTAFRADWMPFAGRDSSGIGVGGIPYSMHEMTREKLIVFKSSAL